MLDRRRRSDALRRVPLFARLSRRELSGVAAIAAEEQFPEGYELTREGETGRTFYVLLDGQAEVWRGGERVETRGGGDFFGEIALMAHSPRTATVRTVTPVRALVIADRPFRALLGRHPDVHQKVIRALSERL